MASYNLCFVNSIANDLIADLNIIEALKANAALVTLPDLSYVLFLMTQGAHITFIDDVSATVEPNFSVAAQLTFGHTAACYLAKLRCSEYRQDLGTPNNCFLDLRLEHTVQSFFDILSHSIDDLVKPD